MKDVRYIYDIPDIEKYIDYEFDLVLYERGDNLQIYSYDICDELTLYLEINSKESLIQPSEKCADLITQEGVDFLQWTIVNTVDEVLESYCYRPLLTDSVKDF